VNRRLAVARATTAVLIAVTVALAGASVASAKSKSKSPLPKSGVETPAPGTVTETGSSLIYPLFNLWAGGYSTKYSTVQISTGSTGSGTGITDATDGTINIGASDAYLPPTDAGMGLLNIPLAISAQIIVYNLPGITAHVQLTGGVLSQIYQGKITTWNDPAIAALNPTITLPAIPIVTLHRADSSGDTFLFSSFLSDTDANGWGKTLGFNTTITWPAAPGALAETGNSGMVAGCGQTPGCIAYVGIAYLTQSLQAKLGYAALQNKDKQYELPTAAAIAAEAAAFVKQTPPNGTISLIYGKAKGAYPIINYEYAIVKTAQTSTTTAKSIRSVLEWAINPTDGNSADYLSQVDFQALPASVEAQSLKQILEIK
jgi:phosphate transport system substrate-binding protein